MTINNKNDILYLYCFNLIGGNSINSNFDTLAFAALLEKAKSHRSINQYANEINVSAAHISRLLRKLIDSPPSPDTISKLATGAYNGVTYDELMLAAGHINCKIEQTSSQNKKIETLENKKKFFQVILSALYSKTFEWNLNKTNNGPMDLIIEIKDFEYSKWYIEINEFVTLEILYNIYGKIASMELSSDIKISIAVGSENEFNLFTHKPPKSLSANVYVMLVDLTGEKILKEEKLCQYGVVPA